MRPNYQPCVAASSSKGKCLYSYIRVCLIQRSHDLSENVCTLCRPKFNRSVCSCNPNMKHDEIFRKTRCRHTSSLRNILKGQNPFSICIYKSSANPQPFMSSLSIFPVCFPSLQLISSTSFSLLFLKAYFMYCTSFHYYYAKHIR